MPQQPQPRRAATAELLLSAALEKVYQNEDQYGPFQKCYGALAQTLTGLGFSFDGGPVEPHHAIVLMIQLKLVRELNCHKLDNIVDVVGYAIGLQQVQHPEPEYEI